MRYWRLAIGFVLVLWALYVIVGEHLAGASSDAVVNAEVVTVTTPIAGRLDLEELPLGATVAAQADLGSVEDRRADRIRRHDLEMEAAFEAARLAEAEARRTALEASAGQLEARRDDYFARRLEEWRLRLAHAEARLEDLEQARRAAIGAAIAPPPVAALTGFDALPGPEGDEAAGEGARRTDDLPGPGALSLARERVDVLRLWIAAAEKGVQLGDGYNDTPVSGQQLQEMRRAIAEAEAAEALARARNAAVRSRLEAEQAASNRLSAARLRAPVRGLIWERLRHSGTYVQRGEAVLRMLDCDALSVTVSVTEETFNDLSIGDAAKFRFNGDGKVYPAVVQRLAGAGAATIYRHLAVAPSQEHLERYDVMLQVPGLSAPDGPGCVVGRTGRAFFTDRPLDWLRGLWRE